MAKAPVAGRVKTRLCPPLSPHPLTQGDPGEQRPPGGQDGRPHRHRERAQDTADSGQYEAGADGPRAHENRGSAQPRRALRQRGDGHGFMMMASRRRRGPADGRVHRIVSTLGRCGRGRPGRTAPCPSSSCLCSTRRRPCPPCYRPFPLATPLSWSTTARWTARRRSPPPSAPPWSTSPAEGSGPPAGPAWSPPNRPTGSSASWTRTGPSTPPVGGPVGGTGADAGGPAHRPARPRRR